MRNRSVFLNGKLKRAVLFFSVLCTLFSVLSAPQAHATEWKKGPVQKLARGFTYVIASPFQIPKEVIQTAGEAEPVWLAPWKGIAAGGGSGLYHMGRQGLSGLWDILTFGTPAGRDWDPLFEPASFVPEI
ncbi:MAG: hypothetical protein HY584_00995 [Candidatus Omnitrophica bacterium]|nr:hypothetical protein [Candidatus Omnitrophota bacterium]